MLNTWPVKKQIFFPPLTFLSLCQLCLQTSNKQVLIFLHLKLPTLLFSGNYHVSNQATVIRIMPLVPPAHLATIPRFLYWPC